MGDDISSSCLLQTDVAQEVLITAWEPPKLVVRGGATYLFKGALVLQPFCSQEDPVVPKPQLAYVAAAQLLKLCPYLVVHP